MQQKRVTGAKECTWTSFGSLSPPKCHIFRQKSAKINFGMSLLHKIIGVTVGALLLGMGPHIRHLNRKCHSLGLARPVNWRRRLRYAVCKVIQVLLTQYCPMLLYLGHLFRQCNWAGETANTGVFASEGLQIVMCLLDRLNMGDTF